MQYLNASFVLCREIIRSSNNPIMVSGEIEDLKIVQNKYYDFNLSLPLLFDFYHGIELFLKGLHKNKVSEYNSNHKLLELYKVVQEKYCDEIDISLLSKYIIITENSPEIIRILFTEIDKSVDCYHEILRYPEYKKMKRINQILIMYKGIKAYPFYQLLAEDINLLINLVEAC